MVSFGGNLASGKSFVVLEFSLKVPIWFFVCFGGKWGGLVIVCFILVDLTMERRSGGNEIWGLVDSAICVCL